eukprot:CAMPEP_0183366550 /NCGR_PEP_ID=MMETSP0164_2-20130417/89092_1 /TAXON_ID=221442 /ORGANISM="Coccolithus pelagicus ssp braarudi, Strain PLY182g" /LENGTH=71 /DNA_ID=CAMNT_0025542309 /DNA_START=18 /DNA_END=233 /DNA_ORIENTATION=+
MDVAKKPMFKRYGVETVLDMPRLVFLDTRLPKDANRQLVYPGEFTAAAVSEFIKNTIADDGGGRTGTKDEL